MGSGGLTMEVSLDKEVSKSGTSYYLSPPLVISLVDIPAKSISVLTVLRGC